MAFTLTSNKGNSAGAASGAGIPIGTAQGSGNLMIVGLWNTVGTATITSVTDTFTTTYNNFRAVIGGNTVVIFYGFLNGTGANSLTIVWNTGQADAVAWGEWGGSAVSGSATDGAGQSASGSGITTFATPTITTTAADDLVLNFTVNNGPATPAFGGAWSTASAGTSGAGLGYQADVAAATYTPSVSWSGTAVAASLCLAFKAPAGGATLSVNPTEVAVGSSESASAPFPSPISVVN